MADIIDEFTTAPNSSSPSTYSDDMDTFLSEVDSNFITQIEKFAKYNDKRQEMPGGSYWSTGTAIGEGQVRRSPTDDLLYKANKDIANSTVDPASATADWDVVSAISDAEATKLNRITATSAFNLDNPVHSIVADGAVSEGDAVAVNTDGTATAVSGFGSAGAWGTGTETNIGVANITSKTGGIVEIANDKFFCAYVNNNNNVAVRVFEFDSVTETYTVGAEIERTGSSQDGRHPRVCWDSSLSRAFVASYNDNTNDFFVEMFSVSGTTLTREDTAVIENEASPSSTETHIACDGSGTILVVWNGDHVKAATCTTSTIGTFGTQQTITGALAMFGAFPVLRYDPDNSDYIFVYNHNTSSNGICAVVIDVSGTTVTVNTIDTQLDGASVTANYPSLARIEANKWAFCSRGNGGSGGSTIMSFSVLTRSGTTFSLGTWTYSAALAGTLIASNSSGQNLEWDASAGQGICFVDDFGPYEPVSMVLSYDGSTIVVEEQREYALYGNSSWRPNCAALSNGYAHMYHMADTAYPATFPYSMPETNAGDCIGFAREAAADTVSFEVALPGQIVAGQTGLTARTTYYLTDAGGLTAVDNGRKIGKAISATQLYITEHV